MSGLGDMFGISDIKELEGRPRQTAAKEMLEKLRDQVHPICVAHKWKVPLMEEFLPGNPGLLGVNISHGQKICVRLRHSSDQGNFLMYESVLDTLLHELVHNDIGPHSAKFFKKWDELRAECEKLLREGITGLNMPFAGHGRSLGGRRAPVDARAAALLAAEKRQRRQGVMSGGGQRLGGGEGLWGAGTGTAAQRAAAAAQRRYEISRGCGNRPTPSESRAANTNAADGKGAADWECLACTLINDVTASACDACGAQRSPAAPAGSAAVAAAAAGLPRPGSGRSIGLSCGGRWVGGGGGSSFSAAPPGGPHGGVSKREKRPAPMAVGSASAAASSAAALKRKATGPRPANSLGDKCGAALPGLSTWTCLECPFRFPNAGERRTCESCGAVRQPAQKSGGDGGDGRSNAGVGGGAVSGSGASVADRSWDRESPPWACGRCTVVNVGMFFFCGTCGAERPPGGEAQLTAPGSGNGGRGRGRAGGLGGANAGARVCRVCTFRHLPESSECVACGIPFAESEAAAAAATAAATATIGVGGSGGGGGFGEVRAMDKETSGAHLGATAAFGEPECIDLT